MSTYQLWSIPVIGDAYSDEYPAIDPEERHIDLCPFLITILNIRYRTY